MLFLVDGYNVTKSDPATRDLSLEEQRDALVRRVRVRGRDLLGRGRTVIVFDGREGAAHGGSSGADLEVRFSKDEPADDVIVRHVARASGAVCVVSSDSGLALRARALSGGETSVEVRGREVLFEDARAGSRGRRKRAGRGGEYPLAAGTPPGGNRITAELKALWLVDEDGNGDEE